MDNPIEKRALGVDVRVEQALAAGVYAVDADDVRELLAALRHSQSISRGFDRQNMELTTQLLAVKEHAQELGAKLAASNTMVIQPEQQQVAGLAAGEDIDGQEAYEAWRRVKGLAESGAAPQIDARDVLGALAFCERENKALLEKKTSAGKAYENHIAWLEDQLAKARTRTGGSRELVAAAISIRDRLVDYFRYVADGLPFERAAEANERAQALINGLGLLANDLEAGRLADQCTRLHRNQLMGEQGQVTSQDGRTVQLRADSVCLHGDSAHALDVARRLRARLEARGIRVCPQRAA